MDGRWNEREWRYATREAEERTEKVEGGKRDWREREDEAEHIQNTGAIIREGTNVL